MRTTQMQAAQEQKIDRFQVVRRLGRGSQGSVYLAKDPNLERYVAIKLLHPDHPQLGSGDQGSSPLEGRISSRLRHPNIVSIYEAGEFNGMPYLVFEYVQGQTLRDLLNKHGALSIERAATLIGPILEGIAAAHGEGVMHLDLSPRNILVDRNDVPRIMDFGLSRLAGISRRKDEDEDIITGSLRYMAPEHFLEDDLGPHSDVFALASTFYELALGKFAMHGVSPEEIASRICYEAVDFGELRSQPHGEAFARFLEGAFEKDHRARYADGAAMKEAFNAFLQEPGLAPSAAPASAHSTIEFLMRRMQRKQDFPAISRSLADINRLTGEGSRASADKLANVILRDYALTSKLLKLVNSAYYSGIAGEVKNISHAVVLLGFEQVRMIANSLTFFGHMQGKSSGSVLKDSMTKSFLSGLIARHLAQREKLPAAEEAFICGLFQNLGENLTIYYFGEDYEEIQALKQARAMDKASASRGVLGVTYAELGAAVARTWKLPDAIVETILGLPHDVAPTGSDEHKLRDLAVFANELCNIAGAKQAPDHHAELGALLKRFEPAAALSDEFTLKLLSAGLEKLRQFSQIFEINVDKSPFCQSVQTWMDRFADDDKAHDGAAP